jgi:hypothetical protein
MHIWKTAGALALAALAMPAPAQQGWVSLGTREVNDRVDRDTVRVEGRARFGEIRLCVSRRPVRFYDVDVRFRNGERQDVSLRALLRPGACTRTIDLKGRERDIESVSFSYEARSIGRGRRATVRVYGR